MNFDPDDDQRGFVHTVERFLGPIDIAQRRRDRSMHGRYPAARWKTLAELGLLALAVPEALGGLGGRRVDLALVAEALGQGLAIDPWLENGVLPLKLAAAAGDAGLVEKLSDGSHRAAFAFAEPGRRFRLDPQVRADSDGRLSGNKTFVLGGASADQLFVTAASPNGFALYRVAASDEGVQCRAYGLVDGSEAAEIEFRQARGERLTLDWDALLDVVGDARLCAAAEMLGLAQRLFDDTLDYVKQRQQFGVVLGTFQALQHRLVDCYAKLELARSLVLGTALRGGDDWPAAASGVKAHVGASARHIAAEAVQMHGGMGLTDELAVGHGLKRIMLLDKFLGDEDAGLLDYAGAA